MIQTEVDFMTWIDRQLDGHIPSDIIAFHLNLNESPFTIELIGEKSFSLDEDDWACEENWMPDKRTTHVAKEIYGSSWEQAQENVIAMVKIYLRSDFRNARKLVNAECFALGFVDGDLVHVA